MVFFVIIYAVFLGLTLAKSGKHYSTRRSEYESTLAEMNSDVKARMVYGIISIIVALLPIVDFCLPYAERAAYITKNQSTIFSVDYSDTTPFLCVFFSFICFGSWLIWILFHINYKRNNQEWLEDRVQEREEMEAREETRVKQKQSEDESIMDALVPQFGKPDRTFRILDDSVKNSFMLFSGGKVFYYGGQVVPFNHVIGCEITDDSYTTVSGTKQEVTRSSNGNVVGRALVGGLIAGPAGAIIGGVTSKKETEVIDNTQSVIHHHYYVIIRLSNTQQPILKVDCSVFGDIAEEIKGLVLGLLAENEKGRIANLNISVADELLKLADLKDRGILTQSEFDQQKQRLLSASQSSSTSQLLTDD